MGKNYMSLHQCKHLLDIEGFLIRPNLLVHGRLSRNCSVMAIITGWDLVAKTKMESNTRMKGR